MSIPDISRSTVVAIFKEAENAALKKHWGLPGSDGCGNLRILCACQQGYSPLDYELHLRAVAKRAHQPRR